MLWPKSTICKQNMELICSINTGLFKEYKFYLVLLFVSVVKLLSLKQLFIYILST